jgi:hypothetical protein
MRVDAIVFVYEVYEGNLNSNGLPGLVPHENK